MHTMNLYWKMKFLKQPVYIRYLIAKLKICQNQHAHFLRFLFTEDYLQIKRGLKLVSRPHFSQNFSINIFLWQYYINWPNFITRPCLLCKLFSKIGFMFHACVFDDVTWHLDIWTVKIWLSQEQNELSEWNKNHSFLFYKSALLDLQNKLSKMLSTKPWNDDIEKF